MNEYILKRSSKKVKIQVFFLRLFLNLLSSVAPPYAKKIVLKLFLTPPKPPPPSKKEISLTSKSRTTTFRSQKYDLLAYEWGLENHGQKILLIHGWGGRAGLMGGFVTPFLDNNFRVTTFDAPAHGGSEGTTTDMFEFAKSIDAVINNYGPFDIILGYSFGAACSLLAKREHNIKINKLILISCFSDPIFITESFGGFLGLPDSIISGMRKELEKEYNYKWKWEDIDLENILSDLDAPILIIHDKNDHDVPVSQSQKLMASNPAAKAYITEKHGHRYIIKSDDVHKRCVEFSDIDKNEQ